MINCSVRNDIGINPVPDSLSLGAWICRRAARIQWAVAPTAEFSGRLNNRQPTDRIAQLPYACLTVVHYILHSLHAVLAVIELLLLRAPVCYLPQGGYAFIGIALVLLTNRPIQMVFTKFDGKASHGP